MQRRTFLRGLFAAAVVTAGCAARPPGADAAPLPARPTPPVDPMTDDAGARVEKAQYYIVRRRRYYRPRRRIVRRYYYVRPRRRYYYRPRVYYRRLFW